MTIRLTLNAINMKTQQILLPECLAFYAPMANH